MLAGLYGVDEEEVVIETQTALVDEGFDAVSNNTVKAIINSMLANSEIVRLLNSTGPLANSTMIRVVKLFDERESIRIDELASELRSIVAAAWDESHTYENAVNDICGLVDEGYFIDTGDLYVRPVPNLIYHESDRRRRRSSSEEAGRYKRGRFNSSRQLFPEE